jgi:hypothetical protein
MKQEPPVSVRTRFEKFPATVKGAFVFRGEDGDPHQVVVRAGHVVRIPGSAGRPLPVQRLTVDVPPHEDVFVPFELPIADLDPGWYGFEIDVDVDGSPRKLPGDRRFPIPWPRGTVRTGTIRVDRDARLGEARVTVERLQLATDSTTVRFSIRPPEPIAIRMEAGRSRLDVLSVDLDESSGAGTATAYPIGRKQQTVRIEFQQRGRSGSSRADITIDLP